MAIPVFMPALSPTMIDGTLSKWLKKEGENIQPGDVIAEIETDKASMEVESVDSGKIAKIIVQEGTKKVKVNELIAVIMEESDSDHDVHSIISQHTSGNSAISDTQNLIEAKNSNIPVLPNTNPSTNACQTKIIASPLAKRIASDKGIDLRKITNGSGPGGRIVKNDVLSFAKLAPAPIASHTACKRKEDTVSVISNIREIIANRLLESKREIPHFYLTISCSMDKLLAIRTEVNGAAQVIEEKHVYKVSVNDFIMKASGKAMKEVPEINSSWNGDGTITEYGNIDVALAVATDGGLITPIVRDINDKSIVEASNEIKSLVKRARDNKLRPEEFQGGGFSVSNLGMYGIEQFSAIINPPQSSIMSVGATVQKPVVRNGQVVIENIMSVTLSCDHRVIDGAVAAKFLAAFKGFIEKPITILL